jgi:hypothetical protein
MSVPRRFSKPLAAIFLAVLLSPPAGAILGSQYGLNVDEPQATPAAFPIIAEARFGWVRLWAWWQVLEPQQNQYNFAYLDSQVSSALAAGLQIDLVVASIPSWANGSPANCGLIGAQCATPPTSTAFYSNFMTTLVGRYRGQVGYYEVWNEPDYVGFWNGAFSKYITDILENGANAVHATDATAKVVGPTTLNKINDFEAAVNAACHSIDVLSAHFYPSSNLAADMFSSADTSFQPYIQSTCNKPFWITEYGFGSWVTSEAFQAQQYAAAIQDVPSRGYLARLFLYKWEDGPPGGAASGVGVVGSQADNYRRKPSFASVQDAILANLGLPGVASAPLPRNLAAASPISTSLSWTAGRNAAAHNVYFGGGAPTFRGAQLSASFTPPAAEMRYGQTYNWRIDEVDGSNNVTTGTAWSFTVQPNPQTPAADIVIQVNPATTYYMQVLAGAAVPSFSPPQGLIIFGSVAGNFWSAQADYHKPGFDAFTSPNSQSPPEMTIAVGGLVDGVTYNVYGRYATAPLQPSGFGIAMGLSPGSLTVYDETSASHTVTRDFSNWQEWEVFLGQAAVSGGAVNVYFSNAGVAQTAAWTGLRLSLAQAPHIGNFYTLSPCRVLDTRNTGVPLTQSNPQQVYQVTGVCGVPANALSVALNVTLTGATTSLSVQGFPGDLSPQGTNVVSALAPQNATIAGMAALPLATSGAGTLGIFMTLAPPATVGQADLLLDVTGYFSP